MKPDPNNPNQPQEGESATKLGVRDADVKDQPIGPAGGGPSVAPTPEGVPHYKKDDPKVKIWEISKEDLDKHGLTVKPAPDGDPNHWFIVPKDPTTLDDFRERIKATGPDWHIVANQSGSSGSGTGSTPLECSLLSKPDDQGRQPQGFPTPKNLGIGASTQNPWPTLSRGGDTKGDFPILPGLGNFTQHPWPTPDP